MNETPPRARLVLLVVSTLPVAAALWFAVYGLSPAPAATGYAARLVWGMQWSAVAILLALVTGIEAVAHERLMSPAFDPLAGKNSKRLRVNRRYLQNTLEQTVVFVPGLMLVAWYATTTDALRMVPATAVTWVAGRWAFWIGYHFGAVWRGLGIFSMGLGLVLLGYGVGRFGYGLAGWSGVAMLLGPFLGIEAWLFLSLSKPFRET